MDTKKTNKAIKLLAQGKSEAIVAESVGVSQPTISRLKHSKKEQIEKEIERLITTLPDITGQLIDDIKISGKLSKVLSGELSPDSLAPFLIENPSLLTKFMELSYRKHSDILKAVGVYPTNTSSIFIQNIFQAGSNVAISPNIMQILGEHLSESLKDEDIIDVEVTED